MITATQSNIGGHSTNSLNASNVSEDKRKLSHANGVYALNQTPDEKVLGIMRLATIVARSGRFDVEKEATCLQCLEIGNPHIESFFVSK